MDGVQVTDVVASCEVGHVALQVLDAKLVEDSLVGAFQDRPEAQTSGSMAGAPLRKERIVGSFGSKAVPGLCQAIISLMPPHG